MIYGKEYTRHEFAGLALSFYVCEHAKTKSQMFVLRNHIAIEFV